MAIKYPKYPRKLDKRYTIPKRKIQKALYLWHTVGIKNKALIGRMVGLNVTAVRYYVNYDEVMLINRRYNRKYYYLRNKEKTKQYYQQCLSRKLLLCTTFKKWAYEYSRKYHGWKRHYKVKK